MKDCICGKAMRPDCPVHGVYSFTQDVTKLLRSAAHWDDGRIGTHWEDCELVHEKCMIGMLAQALAEAQPDAERLRGMREVFPTQMKELESAYDGNYV